MWRVLVKNFVTNEISPTIAENDANHYFDRSILTKMADLGLLGICIPSTYGGAGFDYISLGLACEELEFGDTSLRVILSVHLGLNGLTLLSWGTEDQKRRFLIPQSKGQEIASFGMTEPDAGSDVVGLQSTALRDGQDYVLNGEKTWISLADVADNFLVIAWTDLDKKKKPGPFRLERIHRREKQAWLCQWYAETEVGNSSRQYGLFFDE